MTPLIRRLGTGFLTAGVSLTALTTLAGAPAQAAADTAADTAAHEGGAAAAAAGDDIWFLDPLSAATRRAEVAVPSHPERLEGKRLQWTKARLRTHAGRLAVPATQAIDHSMVSGQAVTITGEPFTFGGSKLTPAGRQQIAKLASSLTGVSAVSCEGYADYTRQGKNANVPLSQRRADAVCDALEVLHPGLVTSARGYGGARPVIVGGETSKRFHNRRVVVVATSNNSAPSAPSLAASFGDAKASLTVTKPAKEGTAPITHYEYSVDNGSSWHFLTTPSGSPGPYTAPVTGLTNGVEYPVTVRAVSETGASEASNVVNVTPATVPGKPNLGDGLGVDDGKLKLFFEPVSGNGRPVTKYEYSVNGGAWTTFVPTGTSLLTTTISDLTNGTAYTVKVRAHNVVGDGDASDALSAKPGAAPSAVSLDPGSVQPGNESATVAFSPPADNGREITGYQYTVDGSTWQTLPTTGTDPLTGTISGLTNGTAYTVQVRAVNELGEGDASNSRTVSPEAALASAPTINFAHFDSMTDLHFGWTAPASDGGSPITTYEARVDGGDWVDLNTTFPNKHQVFPGVTDDCGGAAHVIEVRAVTASGKGATSEAAEVMSCL